MDRSKNEESCQDLMISSVSVTRCVGAQFDGVNIQHRDNNSVDVSDTCTVAKSDLSEVEATDDHGGNMARFWPRLTVASKGLIVP
jgi:hypothetical protein